MSFLFDTDLELVRLDEGKAAKTCFVDSFDALHNSISISGGQPIPTIEIPLKEYIEYVPQDKMLFYQGSETVPDCGETVTWIINSHPHVITER